MPIARARLLGLAALVCLVFFVAVDATGLGRSDAIAALRQRSRQQQKASVIGEVGAGIAGVSLLSKIGEKIGKLVTDHKTQAHGKELAAQIRASKKLWCDILGLQVEAEAGRFAQAASIIKTAPNPKLSKMALRDGTPAMKILPFQNYYNELQTFAYRIASSKRWIKKTLIPMCPALKTKPDEPAAGDAKAAGDAANQPDVKADADGPDPGSRLHHIFKVYDESLLIIATKMAELQAIIKAPPAAPAVPGVAGAAAKSPSPKELDDEAKSIVGKIGAKVEEVATSLAKGAAKDLAQDMTVNALAQLGAGVVADSVVPVVGVASTGTSLFAMGSTIADYNTEWARDEANKEEFLTDARYAACNMLLALFRESCKFPVSDLLFSYFKASDAQKSQELVKIWRSSPFQLLSAYTNLNCPLLHKIKFEAGWDQVYAKSAAAIQEPSSTQVGQIADLFPAFLPIFKAAHQVTDDTQALADVETFEKGQDPKKGYPLMLNTEGQRVGLRAEFLPLLGKIPFGVVKKDQSGLQVPDNTPITGVEFIAHDSAQKPSAAGGLYDDRRPGKGLHDTDKTKKHQAQLKEKGFLAKAIPLTDDKGGHDRTATEIHVRRSTAGIPIRTIYLIHNAKGTKSDTLTTKQEEYLNSKLYIRSHDDMTAVLRKKENAAVGGLGVVFHAFQQHDYFYFCAEKDATLYWDQELKTLVTASRRRVF